MISIRFGPPAFALFTLSILSFSGPSLSQASPFVCLTVPLSVCLFIYFYLFLKREKNS